MAALRIEARLRTYFGPALLSDWRKFREAAFPYIEYAVAQISVDEIYRMGLSQQDQSDAVGAAEREARSYLLEVAAVPCARRQNFDPRYLLEQEHVGEIMLGCASLLTDAVLASHPRGYSTTGRDLINDLVPF